MPSGFTLFELLVVIAIAALALAVVTPQLGAAPGVSAASAARDMASSFREARSRAIGSNREVVVEIDTASPVLRLDNAERALALPSRAVLTSVPADTAPRLRFFPDGSVSGPQLQVQAGAQTVVVTVEPLTGRIRVQR